MMIALWIVLGLVVVFVISTFLTFLIRLENIDGKFHDVDVMLNNLSEASRMNHIAIRKLGVDEEQVKEARERMNKNKPDN